MEQLSAIMIVLSVGMLIVSLFRFFYSTYELSAQIYDGSSAVNHRYKEQSYLMIICLMGYVFMGLYFFFFAHKSELNFINAGVFLMGAVINILAVSIVALMHKIILGKTTKILEVLIGTIDAKDEYTRGHSVQVLYLSQLLYQHLPAHLKRDIVYVHLQTAALVHDIGKIGVSDVILNKQGPLSADEMEIMKIHPCLGSKILTPAGYGIAGDIIYAHHERIDGNGYYGLPSWHIPLEARVIAITDTFSALYTNRVYRRGKSYMEAVEIIRSVSGTQLDAEMVDAFCSISRETVEQICAFALGSRTNLDKRWEFELEFYTQSA